MNKILFDLTKSQSIRGVKYHGGGKYGIVICKYFITNFPNWLAVYYNDSLYIDEECVELCRKHQIESYVTSEGSIVDIAEKRGYIIYSPLFNKDYLNSKDVKIICTIHGLRSLEMPSDKFESLYYRKRGLLNRILTVLGLNGLKKIVQNKFQTATIKKQYQSIFCSEQIHIITVSEHSKASLMCYFPSLLSSEIRVFYSPSTINASIPLKTNAFSSSKYWLMVSGDRWQKNCLRAILAFDQLFHERPDLDGIVVITGLKELAFKKVAISHRDRFVCVGYVDEIQLKSLYHDAYALIYPSLNEGFGYPPLEAMHEGCPVAASAISSIPEVCGEAVLYFNPLMQDEIKMRILQMEDLEIRKYYVEKGKAREQQIKKRQQRDLQELADYLLKFTGF